MIDKDIEETRKVKKKMDDVAKAVEQLQDMFADTNPEIAIGAMVSYLGQLVYGTGMPLARVVDTLKYTLDFYKSTEDRTPKETK